MKNYLRYIFSSTYTRIVVIALVAIAAAVAPFVAKAESQPRDCDTNAMMHCGAYTKTEFDSKYKNGDVLHTGANLIHVYAETGFSKTAFDSTATVDGSVTKDGKVIVNGTAVATAAHSFGRLFISGSNCSDEHKVGDLWERSTECSFRSDSLSAWVYLKDGVFEWAVLKSCGNTVLAKSVAVSVFKCTNLTAVPQNGDVPLTVSFTAKATAEHAKIESYTFDFGDGAKQVVKTSNKTATTDHTYQSAGSFKTFVTIQTDMGTTKQVNACTVTIKATTPVTPPTPTPTPKPTPTPSLPNTGPESAAFGLLGSAGLGMVTRGYIRSRKSLLSALLRK